MSMITYSYHIITRLTSYLWSYLLDYKEESHHSEVKSSGPKNKIRLTETHVFANPVE